MKIKTRIISIIVIGIVSLFGASFYSSQELNSANREYSAQESIIAHSSAWISNMDVEFTDKLYVYDPIFGAEDNIDIGTTAQKTLFLWVMQEIPYSQHSNRRTETRFTI